MQPFEKLKIGNVDQAPPKPDGFGGTNSPLSSTAESAFGLSTSVEAFWNAANKSRHRVS
jgi:hypothetical protein